MAFQVHKCKILDKVSLRKNCLFKAAVQKGTECELKDIYCDKKFSDVADQLTTGKFYCVSKCQTDKYGAITLNANSKVYDVKEFNIGSVEQAFLNSTRISLSEARDSNLKRRCTVAGKILSIQNVTGEDWRRQDICLADNLTKITVKIWDSPEKELPEDAIEKRCEIKNLEVSLWNSKKELKSTNHTMVNVAAEEETLNVTPMAIADEDLSIIVTREDQMYEYTFGAALLPELKKLMDHNPIQITAVGTRIIKAQVVE